MKINIIGPSCVGKSTLAKIIAKKNGWQHFDLDLVFIDRDYLAQTKIFRYRPKVDYRRRINTILDSNDSWIIEGVYLIEKVIKEADLIIFINISMLVPLRWQWKRYFTDRSQRDTYGFLNNVSLTKEIFNEYLKKIDPSDFDNETSFYMKKYEKILEKYENKLRVVTKIEDLEKLRTSGFIDNL